MTNKIIKKSKLESDTTKVKKTKKRKSSSYSSSSSDEARLRSEGRMDYESYMI